MALLHEVLRRGTLAEVEAALASAASEEICAALPHGRSLLHYAAFNPDHRVHAPVIDALRDWAPRYGIPGAGTVDDIGYTPLHYRIGTYGVARLPDDDPGRVADEQRWGEAVRELTAAGGNNEANTRPRTALYLAASYGCVGALVALILGSPPMTLSCGPENEDTLEGNERAEAYNCMLKTLEYAAGQYYILANLFADIAENKYPELCGFAATPKERVAMIRHLLKHSRFQDDVAGHSSVLGWAVRRACYGGLHSRPAAIPDLSVIEVLLAYGANPGGDDVNLSHSIGHERVFNVLIRRLRPSVWDNATEALAKALAHPDPYYAQMMWTFLPNDHDGLHVKRNLLLLSVRDRQASAVKEVLARGADATMRDGWRKGTVLAEWLDERYMPWDVPVAEYKAVLKELILAGLDIDAPVILGGDSTLLYRVSLLHVPHDTLMIALLESGARKELRWACSVCSTRQVDAPVALRKAFFEAFRRAGQKGTPAIRAWLRGKPGASAPLKTACRYGKKKGAR